MNKLSLVFNILFIATLIFTNRVLAFSDNFTSLKWHSTIIKEKTKYSDIDVQYPQFIGGQEVRKLNAYIKNLVVGRIAKDKGEIKDLIVSKNETCQSGERYGDELYECMALLSSEYRVAAVVNGIVSIELILKEWTHGGNGNHDEPFVINWDLKSDRLLNSKDLLCGGNYPKDLSPVLYRRIYKKILQLEGGDAGFINAELKKSIDYLKSEQSSFSTPESLLGDILLGYRGASLIFPPYTVASGAMGIIRMPIPYSELKEVICLP